MTESPSLHTSIASVLTAAMQRTDVTQKALARQTGLTQSYISQICAGKKIPTVATLARISDCLDVPLTAFFTAGEERQPQLLTQEESLLLQLYRSMEKKQQALISDLVVSALTRQRPAPGHSKSLP